VHFNMLNEVLNVPLHGVPVRFDGVKCNMVLSAPRFEASRMLKLSYVIPPYSLGSMPPERGQLVQVLPRVLTCASVDDSADV
jgi:hypothetical protein